MSDENQGKQSESGESAVDAAAVKALVLKHDAKDGEIAKAKEKLEKLMAERSAIVEQLHGELKGKPLSIGGKKISIVHKGDSWFLRKERERVGGVEL